MHVVICCKAWDNCRGKINVEDYTNVKQLLRIIQTLLGMNMKYFMEIINFLLSLSQLGLRHIWPQLSSWLKDDKQNKKYLSSKVKKMYFSIVAVDKVGLCSSVFFSSTVLGQCLWKVPLQIQPARCPLLSFTDFLLDEEISHPLWAHGVLSASNKLSHS